MLIFFQMLLFSLGDRASVQELLDTSNYSLTHSKLLSPDPLAEEGHPVGDCRSPQEIGIS